jgi:2-keto-4-pentenoate hydratase/2-oxohepta-3-ene-1,7-dioic acid hydratase in catechol pathway
MKWLSFWRGEERRPGIVTGDGQGVVDLSLELERPGLTWEGLLEEARLEELADRWRRDAWRTSPLPLADLRLAPPLARPSKIVCLGLNYREHAREQGKEPPERPLLFAKAPSCIVGPGDPIRIPPQEDRVDAEAELALIVARRARAVPAQEAAAYVAGITAFNDVSGRRAQFGDRQWFRGKSFDTFGPMGPVVVTWDELEHPLDLEILCRVNGETRQRGRTSDMIFPPEEILSYVSHQMTLWPGDVIATGTPAGVGVFRDPPVFLQPGDVVEVEIQGVGILRNPVAAA